MTDEQKAKWNAACERLHNAERAHMDAETEAEYLRTLEELRVAGMHKLEVEYEVSQAKQ